MSQITLELADGRTLIVDCECDYRLHRCNAMTVYDEIYSWLIVARKFRSPSDEILFYLVKCVSVGWIEVSPEIVESQLYGVGIPK